MCNTKNKPIKGLFFILQSIIPSTNITHTNIPQPDNLFLELHHEHLIKCLYSNFRNVQTFERLNHV